MNCVCLSTNILKQIFSIDYSTWIRIFLVIAYNLRQFFLSIFLERQNFIFICDFKFKLSFDWCSSCSMNRNFYIWFKLHMVLCTDIYSLSLYIYNLLRILYFYVPRKYYFSFIVGILIDICTCLNDTNKLSLVKKSSVFLS